MHGNETADALSTRADTLSTRAQIYGSISWRKQNLIGGVDPHCNNCTSETQIQIWDTFQRPTYMSVWHVLQTVDVIGVLIQY